MVGVLTGDSEESARHFQRPKKKTRQRWHPLLCHPHPRPLRQNQCLRLWTSTLNTGTNLAEAPCPDLKSAVRVRSHKPLAV